MKLKIYSQSISNIDIPLFIKNKRLGKLSEWEVSLFNFLEEWLDEKAFIIAHTSGSTGSPKPIQLLKENMLASARMTNQFFQIDENSQLLLCLSANYIAGKMMIVRAFAAGATLSVIEPSSTPDIDANYDFAAMVPMQVESLLEANQKDQLNRIKNLIIGGSAISAPLEKKLQDLTTSCYSTYGMTETVSHVALSAINGPNKSNQYSALNGIRFSTDERDCLIIHAPHLLNIPIVTNDIVMLLDESSFKWLGRWDNVINSGGVKIFPESVEQKLAEAIAERYFIASMPDARLGEKVVLAIESLPYPAEKERALMLRLESLLTRYERPKQILYIDTFEETASGKIIRRLPIQ